MWAADPHIIGISARLACNNLTCSVAAVAGLSVKQVLIHRFNPPHHPDKGPPSPRVLEWLRKRLFFAVGVAPRGGDSCERGRQQAYTKIRVHGMENSIIGSNTQKM